MPVVGADTFDDGVFDLCIAAILRMPYPALRCSLMIGSILGKTLGRQSFFPSWRYVGQPHSPAGLQ